VNPIDLLINDGSATAGTVMILGEMLGQHARAKARFMPGDVIAFLPRDRRLDAQEQITEIQDVANLVMAVCSLPLGQQNSIVP
jgi:hypothetical protein